MSSLPNKIYSQVVKFCREEGLIKKLRNWLLQSETELFYYDSIEKQGLNVIDAVHCLYDKKRSMFFLKEIDRLIKEKDVVYEAGLGTGLLSFIAAAKGAETWGIEISKPTFSLANKIKQHIIKNNPIQKRNLNFILGNAITFKLNKKVDLVISENIYTGMFYEKQTKIINNSLTFLKKGGQVIPSKLLSYLFFVEAKFLNKVKHKDEIVPSPDRRLKIKLKTLSKPFLYDKINFTKPIPLKPERNSFDISIDKSGIINGLLIYSEVIMPSGAKIKRFDTSFLNGDIILAINPPVKVVKKDIIRLNFSYKYGSLPKNATLKIKRISK